MDKIWWKRFVFALLGFGLYLLDTGSDTWVGNRLIQKCHVKFGAAVLCLVYVLPGLFRGIAYFASDDDKETIFMRIVKCLSLWIFCVPMTACALLYNLFKLDDEALDGAKAAKVFEVLFEAFPQATLGLYMMFVLQQVEVLNYISIAISSCSLVYGTAESVTFKKFNLTAPFSKVIFSGLSGIIDNYFRILFISFFASLSSPYCLLLIPITYAVMFYLSISIKHKQIKINSEELLACFMSLPSSTYEHEDIDYTLRPLSKLIFNILAVMCLCFTSGQFWKDYPVLESKVLPPNVTSIYGHCGNICNLTDISVCTTFNQTEGVYHGVLITLWVLLALSTLEGILERYLSFMPHRKFLEEINEEDENVGSEQGSLALQENP